MCYSYNNAVHRSTDRTSFDLVLSRPPPEFIDHPLWAEDPNGSIKQDLKEILKVAIGKEKTSLEATQAMYKKDFDKGVWRARKLRAGEVYYLKPTIESKSKTNLSTKLPDGYES